ncbi:MAG TPA: histone deacetylase family protein [Gemmatimonadaceae bacterium]|nr:histone deacetylase family protein [Gemmatimonadaceae bacterium]
MREVQRIFRTYYGTAYAGYAEKIPELLRRQPELGFRVLLIDAENHRGDVLGFALAFHFPRLRATVLDFLVVDPDVRQRGVGGALYESLREYLARIESRGLYLEVRPDDPELEPDAAVRRENRARIRFYERFGARVIAGTTYEAKRPGRAEGEPYLMFDPLGAERRPSAEEVRGVMRTILFGKYEYPPDDEYALSIVESVREDPVALQPPRASAAQPPAPVPPTAPRQVLHPIKVLVPEQHTLHHVRERGYVERPVRVERIIQAIGGHPGVAIAEVKEFGEGPITAVHDPDFVDYLSRVCPKLPPEEAIYPYVFPIRYPERKPVDEEVQAGYYCIDTFTPLMRNAYIAARAAVDAALSGAELIEGGERLVYAVCRPPGHHAERRVYGGFCYFNNAAIAAHRLTKRGRVALLDIDFHHGNGTQDIFWRRSDVFTASIHGDPSYAYPYFAGFADEIGEGEGEGFNLNVPLPEDVEDDAYLAELTSVLGRIAEYVPKTLVLSLGLDIAKGDPTGAWRITPDGFERIGQAVGALGLPTLVVQEGGYDSRVLGRNARRFITGLQQGIRAADG